MFEHYNPNPRFKRTGDCAVRAISKALDMSWDDAYLAICFQGFMEKDMPNGNSIWGAYLRNKGFTRGIIPDSCPDCYTLKDFCTDNPEGVFVVGTGTHVIAVVDGKYYDAWDSGNEIPVYYWKQRKDDE